MTETVSDETSPRFYCKDGKTMFCNSEDPDLEFGDFSLKLLGELSPLNHNSSVGEEGYWVASCGIMSNGRLKSRIIVLPASTFDSKNKLQETLRKKLGGGVISIGGGITGSHISEYYLHLKRKYESSGICKAFYKSAHLGHQKEDYWCLSRELHIRNCTIIPQDEHLIYVTEDHVLQNYATVLQSSMLYKSNLDAVCQRYIELSSNFCDNQVAFMLATSFLLTRNMSTTMPSDIGESNIGVVYSKERNVGKSFTLSILAKGQGLESKTHPLLCSGGDQNVCGTSLKMLMQILQSTTLTCFVDDPKLTESLGEFLLQVNSGLLQGSSQTGLNAPKGSLLLSTNSIECDRVHGRVLRMDFVKDNKFGYANESGLYELEDLVNQNKGLLLAWVLRYRKLWCSEDNVDVNLIKLRRVLETEIPNQQPRWYKGAMLLLYTYSLFHSTAGIRPDIREALKRLRKSCIAPQKVQPFWDRLQLAIQAKLDQEEFPLVWLNPLVSLKVEGDFVPGIAISSSAMQHFPTISGQEVKDELDAVSDMGKKTISIFFATREECTLAELKKKNKSFGKCAKAFRIPRDVLDERILKQIDSKCGVAQTDLTPADRFKAARPVELNEEFEESAPILEEIQEGIWNLAVDFEMQHDKEEQTKTPEDIAFMKELTPNSKRRYSSLTPRRQAIFEEGFKSCKRKEDQVNVDASAADVDSHTGKEQELSNSKRRRLFAEGTTGVFPCERTTNTTKRKGRQNSSKDQCAKCKSSSPPKHRNRKAKYWEWIECDKCRCWFHLQCVGLTTAPSEEVAWDCEDCSENES